MTTAPAATPEDKIHIVDDPMKYGEDYHFIIQVKAQNNPDLIREYPGCISKPPNLDSEGLELQVIAEIMGTERVLSKKVLVAGKNLSQKAWTACVASDGVSLEARMLPIIAPHSFPHMISYNKTQRRWLKLRRTIANSLEGTVAEKTLQNSILGLPSGLSISAIEDFLKIRRCARCSHFDRKQGHDYYTEMTHKETLAGDRRMNMDIGEKVAETLGIRALDPAKVGLCLQHETLIEDDFEGCTGWKRHG